MKEKIAEWNKRFENASAVEVLEFFIKEYGKDVALGTSLGLEDQVLTDMMLKISKDVRIFTLDTGRFFPETYNVIDKTNKKYDFTMEVYFPQTEVVQNMVKEKGINLFYDSVENRKQCCNVRKVEPLKRALTGVRVWVTGIRKDQSVARFFTPLIEWDKGNNLIKINPLLKWTEKDAWAYIKENEVPYNELHDQGFPSIGCQPCTRAVKPGEDIRAGRWWWEEPEHNECGLHVKK